MDPGYTHRVRESYPDLDRLFSAGEYVGDLLGHPGWAHIQGLLDAEIAKIDATLDGSKPLRHDEYTHLHGQRRGLKASSQLASAVHDRYVAAREEQERKHERTWASPRQEGRTG